MVKAVKSIVELPGAQGIPDSYLPFHLHRLRQQAQESKAPHLHVVAHEGGNEGVNGGALASLQQTLHFLNPTYRVVVLPPWDCLPYDRVSPHVDVMAARLEALSHLCSDPTAVDFILTTHHALVQKLPPAGAFRLKAWKLQPKDHVDRTAFLEHLTRLGYRRQDVVYDVGEFAVRGSLIDLFLPNLSAPVRLDFFDDTLESIHTFDLATQMRAFPQPYIVPLPLGEVVLNTETIRRFREGYRDLFAHRKTVTERPLYQAISQGKRYAGVEHWLPLFYPTLETLWDLVPATTQVTLGSGVPQALEAFAAQIEEHYQARQQFGQQFDQRLAQRLDLLEEKSHGAPYDALAPDQLYQPLPLAVEALAQRKPTLFSPFQGAKEAGKPEAGEPANPMVRSGWDFAPLRQNPQVNLFETVAEKLLQLRQEKPHHQLLLSGWTEGSLQRLTRLLQEHGLEIPPVVSNLEDLSPPLGAAILPLRQGFQTETFSLLTEEDLLGERLTGKSGKSPKSKRQKDLFRSRSSFEVGDILVHQEHGLGKYTGLEAVKVGTGLHDFLVLVYDGGDKLFVPVENMNVLSRYGSETEHVTLDKLGLAHWQNRKARVKKRLYAVASHLIALAATRQVEEATAFLPQLSFESFCERFPYVETEDQLQAIEETLADLASGKPMDRLICGDVGFGKTEVAMRAAHVVASCRTQVAIVVPTTLLARQHFQKFQERFRGTSLRIAQLSRLVPQKEAGLVKKRLADGEIDIIIATHGVLADSIRFSNLGLLVVDEEQHFGVKQKEKLKNLRKNVHVLTLTATPIPRTLQLSLTGVRDLSLIATPPVDRFAVRTFILPFDGMVMREAILREQSRGGQVFYVCPRVQDLEKVRERVERFVPEVRLAVVHGQLTPLALEAVMTQFYNQEIDVLISTNIIESGIDIPTANTLLVHRADLFGLAQLYQLRGRVGRGKARGYAYLTLANQELLSPTALRRLEILQSLDTLGSGFSLASHDMDIRGAGNLVGEEQSGHIREVGIELYQQLLEEAIEEQKQSAQAHPHKPLERKNPQMALPFSFRIPETYIPALDIRIELYQRLADIGEEDRVEAFAAELVDRFGTYPPEVDNLLASIYLKILCYKASIEDIKVTHDRGVFIRFSCHGFPHPERLIGWIQTQKNIRVSPDNRLVLEEKVRPTAAGTFRLRAFLKEIVALTVP
jgi:transcription-repair coupling factor (superfamily II helicase)